MGLKQKTKHYRMEELSSYTE